MAHEITETDRVGVHRKLGQAWHGLGTLIDDLTPVEAQEQFLPWETNQYEIFARDFNGKEIEITDHVANFRSAAF